MASLNLINYQISQLKKQIVKLEIKKTKVYQHTTAPPAQNRPDHDKKFFICDDQENFCMGNIKELENFICNQVKSTIKKMMYL